MWTLMTSPSLDAPASIQEDAAYFVANNARWWKTLYRLRAYCSENGPIQLPDGKVVGHFADGFSWDSSAVAQEFPNLITEVEASLVGSKQDVERALSVVLEEVPALRIGAVKHTVDKDAAAGTLRAGGSAAERLKPLRIEKSKLQVRS